MQCDHRSPGAFRPRRNRRPKVSKTNLVRTSTDRHLWKVTRTIPPEQHPRNQGPQLGNSVACFALTQPRSDQLSACCSSCWPPRVAEAQRPTPTGLRRPWCQALGAQRRCRGPLRPIPARNSRPFSFEKPWQVMIPDTAKIVLPRIAGRLVVAWDEKGGRATVIDLRDGQAVGTISVPGIAKARITSIDISPDGRCLAAADAARPSSALRCWSVDSGQETTIPLEKPEQAVVRFGVRPAAGWRRRRCPTWGRSSCRFGTSRRRSVWRATSFQRRPVPSWTTATSP